MSDWSISALTVSLFLVSGESQRIQLATSLGSALVGALYVLDEPSIVSTRETIPADRHSQESEK